MILGFRDYDSPARALAQSLDLPYAEVEVHRFPDGEDRLSLNAELPQQVIICRSLDRPNDKLIHLLLLCRHLRQQGVQQITLVAPYLCYMRQDMAFHPGEIVSQPIIARFLAEHVDRLITVDPHLHRVASLGQLYPDTQTTTLSARPLLVDYLRNCKANTLLLGPDRESEQWVSAIAQDTGLDFAVADKQRHGDRQVEITLPNYGYAGRPVVLIDDVISTGNTLAQITRLLKEQGATKVDCLVTHPLFSSGAMAILKNSGIEDIISTDTIVHESNRLSMVQHIARAITK